MPRRAPEVCRAAGLLEYARIAKRGPDGDRPSDDSVGMRILSSMRRLKILSENATAWKLDNATRCQEL